MTPIQEEILALKREKEFTILCHNYVDGSVQDIADFVGDSLELSQKAKKCGAKNILFCGVRFMAETAKLLSPDSHVYTAHPGAGCPMTDMCQPEALRAWKRDHAEHLIIAYVNTTAETKSIVDICVTSGNAERILKQLDTTQPILFLPDQNLGANLNARLGIKMDLWNGFCSTHHRISVDDIGRAKADHPESSVFVHLECKPEVVALADAALSTAGMLKYVENHDAPSYIVGTEEGMIYRLRKEFPEKTFYGMKPSILCPNMKKVELANVLDCLKGNGHEIELSDEILEQALRPVEKMLALS